MGILGEEEAVIVLELSADSILAMEGFPLSLSLPSFSLKMVQPLFILRTSFMAVKSVAI